MIDCLACGCAMRYDHGQMERHMRTSHPGLTLEMYYREFVRNSGQEQETRVEVAPGWEAWFHEEVRV